LYFNANEGQIVNGLVGYFSIDGNSSPSEVFTFGSRFADRITGVGGADFLFGWNGDDTLEGRAGADLLSGGEGIDTASYNHAKAGVTASLATPAINKGEAAGDTYDSIEWLSGSAFRDSLFGNAGNNVLNGRQGADRMAGGAGNDTYYVDNRADVIVEKGHGGTADRVLTAVSYSLKSGVAVEVLATTNPHGKAPLQLGGNSYANTIIGNAGNNLISGAGGADKLTGLGGSDTFVFNTAPSHSNVDVITDFNVSHDTVWLDNTIFSALSIGALPAVQFTANASGVAVDGNDRIVYETDTGRLMYDVNGSAAGGAVHFATLKPNLALTNQDFFVV
jgi:Ca2+-binding RTX toxin-like protein